LIPAAGIGHVYESTDGGHTFSNITGDLPDIPVNDIVRVGGKLVIATDIGVYVRSAGSWSVYGTGLPKRQRVRPRPPARRRPADGGDARPGGVAAERELSDDRTTRWRSSIL
jgi:hypothetical protein